MERKRKRNRKRKREKKKRNRKRERKRIYLPQLGITPAIQLYSSKHKLL